MTRSPDDVRVCIRAILASLGSGAPFADSDDVFARGLVRSLNLVELVTAVEDAYGFEVTQRDVFDGHLTSVDRLVAYIVARTGAP